MTNSIKNAGNLKIAAVLFLTFGLILYSVPASVFAADETTPLAEQAAAAPMTEGERAATASEASLDVLTQSAAAESQKEQTLNQAFAEHNTENNQGQTGQNNSQQDQTGDQTGNSNSNAQARIGQRVMAVSNTLGEFASLCNRQGNTVGNSQSTEGTQNFAAAMGVMGNSSFLSQLVMNDMKAQAPAGFESQMKAQIDGMAQRFTDMAQKFSQMASQGQNGNSTDQGTGGSTASSNGPMNSTGGGPNSPTGPNGPTGQEMTGPGSMPGGMPEQRMPMFTPSDMAMVAMAVVMGASPDRIMEGMSHMMEARAEYVAANFGNNSNSPNATAGTEGMHNEGPMPPGAFNPGAGPNPGGQAGPGFDPALSQPGPPPGIAEAVAQGVHDNLAQQFAQQIQQQIRQQIVQADPRAAAELQALKGANETVAAINVAGGSVTRNDIVFTDPVSGHTDHLHNVVFTVGNETGVQHVDANVSGGVHDHDINQIVDNSPSQAHIPVN